MTWMFNLQFKVTLINYKTMEKKLYVWLDCLRPQKKMHPL